jgi:hypothetical protein
VGGGRRRWGGRRLRVVVRWKPPVACLQRTGGGAGAWSGSPVFQGGGGEGGYTVKKV